MPDSSRASRIPVLALLVALAGCAPPPERAPEPIHLRPLPGLSRVDVPIPGVLDLRSDHRISGYDEILVEDTHLLYRPGSIELTQEAERVFLRLLQASLVTAVEASGIPLAAEPGRCAMEVGFRVVDLDLETAEYSPELADMVVEMVFRDSLSGDPLLRYARGARIEHPAMGATDDEQLRRGLARIVVDMDVTKVLRPAGLATDLRIAGCEGRLGDRGRAINEGTL